LFTSDSVSEFSDRVEFLDRMSQADADLIVRARVTQEELTRREADLQKLLDQQAGTVAARRSLQSTIDAKFQELQSLVGELQDRFESEQAAAAALLRFSPTSTFTGNGLQACPVAGPRSYYNDFGAPRSGGRTHQGNDILAPYGTPVVAAQAGRLQATSNSLGGISAFVYGDGGDLTYYAHLSGYAGASSGSHVSAGTQIGAVGTSGNAQGGPPHLHFEYHPGGGGATNPYPYLRAVCG
jgi:murein DD-endopeptidase MepM/ murein hydrolase activator NlpD